MSDDKKPMITKLKLMSFMGYLMFFGLGLLFFFFSAFLVILIRTKSDTKIIMPDLVGQNYVDVHNELMRLRLKVKVETRHYIDKNDGEVLYQSISPGNKLESGSKLYITINNGTDRVIIPDLKGQQISSAKELLNKVLSGENYVSLELGGITYIPLSEGLSPDTVIDQIPQPGKITTTRDKIYLLVTESGNKKDKSSSLDSEHKGNPFPFVAAALIKKQIPFKLKEIVTTKDKRENGLITALDTEGDKVQLTVSLFPFEEKNYQGYETISFNNSKKDKYSAIQKNPEEKESKIEVFKDLDIEEGEFKFVYYRVGNAEVNLLHGNDSIKSFKYFTDYKK